VATRDECLESTFSVGRDILALSKPMCPASQLLVLGGGRWTMCHAFCHDQAKAGRADLCKRTEVHSTTKYGRAVFQVTER